MQIKKIMLVIFLFIISVPVKAEEQQYPEITDDVEIRYKWYKEIASEKGEYYPLRKIKEGDNYDKNNYKFVNSVHINEESCSYPNEFYLIEKITYLKYKKTYDATYVVIENIEPNVDVKIYYENKALTYNVVSHENNKMIIHLIEERLCDELLFYINTNNKYKISLYRDKSLEQIILSREFENQKISVPNYTWILETTQFYKTNYTKLKYTTTSLTEIVERTTMCAAHEKYVYKYNVTKEYYDDEYHAYVEGYIKDENDYKFYYKGEPITIINTKEVITEKIKEVPKIEYKYIYIEKDAHKEENATQETKNNDNIMYTTIEKYVLEKENTKIPKKVYYVIISLISIIMLIIIKETVEKYKKN